MQARFCTVEGDSEDEARTEGAEQLGVLREDVAVSPLPNGSYRVEVVRAPFAIDVEVSEDRMEGVLARVEPALGDYPQPTKEDLVQALSEAGVVSGILSEELDQVLELVSGKGLGQRNVVVARGRRPARGKSSKLTRHYERPTEEEPRRRHVVVRDGELLIEREPATAGEPGYGVTGETLVPPAGEDPPVLTGAGIVADEQQLAWRASAPGFGYLVLDEQGLPSVVPAVAISADRLHAYLDLRGPGAGEDSIARDELDAAIAAAGVVHGLRPWRIGAAWKAFEDGRVAKRPIRIARGTPARDGRDAGLDLAVRVGLGPGRIDEETGRIDYRERGMVSNVRAGQHVGTWLPATPGVDGVGVDGSRLPAVHGAEATLVPGENVSTSELPGGAVSILAGIEGVVVAPAAHHVDVVDLVDVGGDVDYRTGNVDAQGCVVVRGSVRSGFRVTAKYDVAVHGAVEDAVVAAGATLSVGKGILGGHRGRVFAAKRVSTTFAQNAHIRCGGDVELDDSSTNSVVECAGRLLATQGRGRLVGGSYTVTAGVVAKELGSDLGVLTTFLVGMDPEIERRLRELGALLERNLQRSRKLRRGLGSRAAKRFGGDLSREGAMAARRLAKERRELTLAEVALRARKRLLEESLFSSEPLAIDVLGRVHPGVEITICGASVRVDDTAQGVRYQYHPERRRIEVESL